MNTPRLQEIAAALRSAGFPVALCPDMDAWQKTHVAWISPLANALYLADGNAQRLARTPDLLIALVRAIREGFRVLHALGIPITPTRLRIWELVPEPIMVFSLGLFLRTHFAELIAVRHALAARGEMGVLVQEYAALRGTIGVPTPHVDELKHAFHPDAQEWPAGSARRSLHWRGTALLTLLLAGLLASGIFWRRRRQPAALEGI